MSLIRASPSYMLCMHAQYGENHYYINVHVFSYNSCNLQWLCLHIHINAQETWNSAYILIAMVFIVAVYMTAVTMPLPVM